MFREKCAQHNPPFFTKGEVKETPDRLPPLWGFAFSSERIGFYMKNSGNQAFYA